MISEYFVSIFSRSRSRSSFTLNLGFILVFFSQRIFFRISNLTGSSPRKERGCHSPPIEYLLSVDSWVLDSIWLSQYRCTISQIIFTRVTPYSTSGILPIIALVPPLTFHLDHQWNGRLAGDLVQKLTSY